MMSRGPYPIMLILAMSLPGAARALGLGDIRVESALNEPLTAQIDIVGATRDELALLTAKIANREIFQRYGADRPSFLSTAVFKVGKDAQGRPVLNVRSADPFTDPLVSFLVELRWGKNEVVREYSLLLDPPSYRDPRPKAEVAVASLAPAAQAPAAVDRPAGVDRPAAAAAAEPTAGAATTAKSVAHAEGTTSRSPPAVSLATADHATVTVAPGDTLRHIVRRAGARTETAAQTLMIAIFRANPNGFDGNINRLHRGAVLELPTPAELAAISSTEARREVRAQMTAWRLDGRQGAAPRVASTPSAPPATTTGSASHAASAPAAAGAADANLANRVQSLEQQLDDMHKLLADENARLQSLNQAASLPAANALPAAPAAPVATAVAPAAPAQSPAAPAQSPAATEPSVPAPVAASTEAPHPRAATNSAELVHAPILASARAHPAGADAADTPTPVARTAEIFGPVAVTLGLMVAGFAYIRRRWTQAPQPAGAAAAMPPPDDARDSASTWASPAVSSAAADVAATSAPLDEPISPMEAFRPSAMSAAIRSAQVSESLPQTSNLPQASNETTSSLEIDIEALERSYLESMPGSSAADDAGPLFDGMAEDPTLADTAKVVAMHVEGDTEIINAGLKTVLMDVQARDGAMRTDPRPEPQADGAEGARENEPGLDFNLVDLDATAQHVHMPSGLNDAPVMAERRTNIVDVLKMAIERDPKRSDLRMKLLETYYTLASTNQREFLDAVRKLHREPDLLTADDWHKVTMMGRDIVGDDILFADLDPPKGAGDLANCA
jgi:FimV-like protein